MHQFKFQDLKVAHLFSALADMCTDVKDDLLAFVK